MATANIPSWPKAFIIRSACQNTGISVLTLTPTEMPQSRLLAPRSFTRYKKSSRSTVAMPMPITTVSSMNPDTRGLMASLTRSNTLPDSSTPLLPLPPVSSCTLSGILHAMRTMVMAANRPNKMKLGSNPYRSVMKPITIDPNPQLAPAHNLYRPYFIRFSVPSISRV